MIRQSTFTSERTKFYRFNLGEIKTVALSYFSQLSTRGKSLPILISLFHKIDLWDFIFYANCELLRARDYPILICASIGPNRCSSHVC